MILRNSAHEKLTSLMFLPLDENFHEDVEVYYVAENISFYGFGSVAFACWVYFIYHVISKIRGTEKNARLNTYGITLAFLGLISVGFWFSDELSFIYANEFRDKYHDNHLKLYNWCWSVSDNAYLLLHWSFNWRYIKSTFRLPLL